MANKKQLDVISRKDLIKAVQAKQFAIADNTHPYEAIRIQGKYFREVVDNVPTVDAVEVVHGRWCEHDWIGIAVKGYMACSNCNVMIPKPDGNLYCLHRLYYCPNCGADMRDGGGDV